MRSLTIVLCVALCGLLVIGCGPRRISEAEQRAQEAQEQIAERQQETQAALEKAREQALLDDLRERKQLQKEIKVNHEQYSRQPLPDGVMLVGRGWFLIEHEQIGVVQGICQGDGGGVHSVREGRRYVQVKCYLGAQSKYRSPGWQRRFERSLKTGRSLAGLEPITADGQSLPTSTATDSENPDAG